MATAIEPDVKDTPRRTGAGGTPATPAAPARKPSRRGIIFGVLGTVLLLLVGAGVRKMIWGKSHVRTDNAQVDGHILPVLPKVGGFVAEVRIVENQPVKAGDTIIVLDDRDLRARLQQAEADLATSLATVSSRARVGQAEAMVAQAQSLVLKTHADLDRIQPLATSGIVSQQQLDAAQAAARSADAALASAQAQLVGADARVAAARASLDQAALQLSYTRITAPSGGVVSKKSVEVGQLVQPGQPLLAIVPLDDVWVVANLKETETADVTPGDVVDITVDAYPGRHFAGEVESLSPATGAKFSLLPPDNATGNFTKVVQRIPVRVRLDQPRDQSQPLRPGMSVVATITTK